jgi:hypothetical protein
MSSKTMDLPVKGFPDGRELLYRSSDATVAVAVETEPTFNPGNPEVLFRGTFSSTKVLQIEFGSWDIHRDGERFLMVKPQKTEDEESVTADAQAQAFRKINIILNWFEELKQRVPVD